MSKRFVIIAPEPFTSRMVIAWDVSAETVRKQFRAVGLSSKDTKEQMAGLLAGYAYDMRGIEIMPYSLGLWFHVTAQDIQEESRFGVYERRQAMQELRRLSKLAGINNILEEQDEQEENTDLAVQATA
jgi:hypothetical protein